MRQLVVQVARSHGAEACGILRHHGAVDVARMASETPEGDSELVLAHLSNRQVGRALSELEALPDLRVAFLPQGAVAFHPPSDRTPGQVVDVSPLSPIEVYVSGLQSIGSWKGFLAYAAIAGIVAWVALFTDTSYLLVGAMLVAPYTSPALNLALGSARGDRKLILHSLGRYFASIGVTSAVAALLSWSLGLEAVTPLMGQVATLSSVAVLLPLVAGAAGALHLVHSERTSLVSGAAVGMLVAASLAPPAALVGMGGVLGAWGLVGHSLFVILLQLIGLNLTGALVFRAYGLTPEGVRFRRGRGGWARGALACSLACLLALTTWQLLAPGLQRASRASRARAEVERVVRAAGLRPIEANARYPGTDAPLLVTVYVEAKGGAALEGRLAREIQHALRVRGYEHPLVSVTAVASARPG